MLLLRFQALFVLLVLSFSGANAQTDTALFGAIRECNLPAVQAAAGGNPLINAADSNGATPLMWAVYHSDLPVIRCLAENGATVKDSGVIYYEADRTRIYGNVTSIAAGLGKLKALQYLVDSLHLHPDEKGYNPYTGKKDGWTPMFWAVYKGKKSVVSYLLQKGIPVDDIDQQGNAPLTISVKKEHWDIFTLLMDSRDRIMPPEEAEAIRNAAAALAKGGKAKDSVSRELAVDEFIVQLSKAWFGDAHICYASSLNNLAHTYQFMGQYGKALPLFEQAISIYKKASAEEHPSYASSLNNLAVLYRGLGQYEKALPLFELAISVRKKTLGAEHPKYAGCLDNLAQLYRILGQYDKALPLLVQATAITKKALGREHADYAAGLNGLGTLYRSMGQYDKALPLHVQAIEIYKGTLGTAHPSYALSLNNLASLYQDMGQYDKALRLFEEALAIKGKALGEKHHQYANTLNSLARLYNKMGKAEKAITLYEQAIAIRKNALGEEHALYASSLNNLARLYINLGRYDQALPLFVQAIAIFKRTVGEEHPYYATSLNYLAKLFYSQGEYEKALPLYGQALSIRKKTLGEEHPDYVSNLYSLSLLYQDMGRHDSALSLLTEVSALTFRYLARTYTTLSEQEKITLLQKESSRFNMLPALLMRQKHHPAAVLQQAYAHELVLKGMVLEDQKAVLNSIRKSGDNTALQLYEAWCGLKKSLGGQLLLPFDQRVLYFDSLQQTATRLEQELSRRSAAFRKQQQSLSLSANHIARKLTPGQAAVEFIRFPRDRKKPSDIMYAALVLLPRDTAIHFVPLCAEQQLQQLLSATATKINPQAAIRKLYPGTAGGPRKAASSPDSLYLLVWKPLEQHLRGIRTVFYAPAGLLHRVAFGALRTDATHLLIDQYNLNQVLSTRSIALQAPVAQKLQTAAVWGDIEYDPQGDVNGYQAGPALITGATAGRKQTGWASLKGESGSLLKIDSLRQVFRSYGVNVHTYNGRAATEEAFKALNGNSPQVLYMATHGFFYPEAASKAKTSAMAKGNPFRMHENPMLRTGLVLAGANFVWRGGMPAAGREDGILTAYEIAQMDLSNTDLVVLGACQTALGDVQGNEGVLGLQRAFKLAGVRQVIMSLWEVPAKQTTELMMLFYRGWLGGRDVREALRSAQLKLKEKYPPHDWAAFVVVE